MKKWEAIFEQNEERIFDALVEAEKQRHEWKNGSGYNICVYLQADGSLRQTTDTQSSYYPSSDDMICIYCVSTFGEYIDQDSYTKSDIKQAVNEYYYDDARFICRQADNDARFICRQADEV